LGRGLSSLISVSDLPVEAELGSADSAAAPAGSSEIPVDQIAPNPHQPRREMNEASLSELAASLKSNGMIQPVIVRKVDSGYQLIAGERRLRAAKLAEFKTIPAIIRDADNFTQAQLALVENIQREDLNPVDRAQAYRALMTQLGLTQQELAARLGEDRTSISHFLRLLDLAENVRELIRAGKLSLGHAKLLSGVSDMLEQQRLAEMCVAQDLSVRNLERLLSTPSVEPAPARTDKAASPHLVDLEKNIARQLGMRVQVRSARRGRGRVIIHYASLDQFDDLMKRMGIRTDD
jgi:ParB family chromosome partitioning protein